MQIEVKEGANADDLPNSVCCSEGPDFETTYKEVCTQAYLDGYEKEYQWYEMLAADFR